MRKEEGRQGHRRWVHTTVQRDGTVGREKVEYSPDDCSFIKKM